LNYQDSFIIELSNVNLPLIGPWLTGDARSVSPSHYASRESKVAPV